MLPLADTVKKMEAISHDQVRRAVQEFWDAFTHQSKNRFQELYSPTAVCFAADGRRSEAARLMWVRREREFFGPRSSVGVKLGLVSVQALRSQSGSGFVRVSLLDHPDSAQSEPGGSGGPLRTRHTGLRARGQRRVADHP
jgi:hypothetical protein